jgi:TetR/AcrR family transcriptional regulator, transcriptional repressor for nem operon
VKEAQADGSVRRDLDPASIAAFLLNSWEGAVMRAKVDRNESALKSFQRVAETVLSA